MTKGDDQVTFSALDTKECLTRAEVEGKKIWEQIFARDLNFGGWLVNIVGIQGSGKTSILHHICSRIITEYPKEIIIWREPANKPFQAINSGHEFQILHHINTRLQLKEMTPEGLKDSHRFKITAFKTITELFSLLQPGIINVVYMNDQKLWIRVINRAVMSPGWYSIFVDESEDIFPSYSKDEIWMMMERFGSSVKGVRKGLVSMFLDTQNEADLDYRISSKIMVSVYLYGSRKTIHSPIWREALQSLDIGSGWIDYGGRFGLISYNAMTPIMPLYYLLDDAAGFYDDDEDEEEKKEAPDGP